MIVIDTHLAFSRFSPLEIKQLKKLIGHEFSNIESLDTENKAYKKTDFSQEEIITIQERLYKIEKKSAKKLREKILINVKWV